MKKSTDRRKAPDRRKRFLSAIPPGAVCGAPFTAGAGPGMEIKDHPCGGKAGFADFALTAAGGAIGHGVMPAAGPDYSIRYSISLIF